MHVNKMTTMEHKDRRQVNFSYDRSVIVFMKDLERTYKLLFYILFSLENSYINFLSRTSFFKIWLSPCFSAELLLSNMKHRDFKKT